MTATHERTDVTPKVLCDRDNWLDDGPCTFLTGHHGPCSFDTRPTPRCAHPECWDRDGEWDGCLLVDLEDGGL